MHKEETKGMGLKPLAGGPLSVWPLTAAYGDGGLLCLIPPWGPASPVVAWRSALHATTQAASEAVGVAQDATHAAYSS